MLKMCTFQCLNVLALVSGPRRAETTSFPLAQGVADQNGPKGNALLNSPRSILAFCKYEIAKKGINPDFLFIGGAK